MRRKAVEMRGRRDDGAALVELALILPLVALLVFGTIDLVRAYRLDIRLEAAAREGAVYGQRFPNDLVCSGPRNDITDMAALEDPDLASGSSYDITVLHGPSSGPFVEVSPANLCQSTGGGAPVVGDDERLRVEITSEFEVLTPLVAALVGDPIEMTRAAEVEVLG